MSRQVLFNIQFKCDISMCESYMSLSSDSLIESTTHCSNSFRNFDLIDEKKDDRFERGGLQRATGQKRLSIVCSPRCYGRKILQGPLYTTHQPLSLTCWHWVIASTNNGHQLGNHHLKSGHVICRTFWQRGLDFSYLLSDGGEEKSVWVFREFVQCLLGAETVWGKLKYL